MDIGKIVDEAGNLESFLFKHRIISEYDYNKLMDFHIRTEAFMREQQSQIETLEKELLEGSKYIVNKSYSRHKDWQGMEFRQCKECFDCDGNHRKDCPVLKAESIIKDNK